MTMLGRKQWGLLETDAFTGSNVFDPAFYGDLLFSGGKPTSTWKLNDSLADEIGGHTLTAVGAPPYVGGICGKAIELSGLAADYLYVPFHADFSPGTGDFYFYGWFWRDDNSTTGGFFGESSTDGDGNLFARALLSGEVQLNIGADEETSPDAVPLGAWFFFWHYRINGVAELGWSPASGAFNYTSQINATMDDEITSLHCAFGIGIQGVWLGAPVNVQTWSAPWDGKVDNPTWKKGASITKAELERIFDLQKAGYDQFNLITCGSGTAIIDGTSSAGSTQIITTSSALDKTKAFLLETEAKVSTGFAASNDYLQYFGIVSSATRPTIGDAGTGTDMIKISPYVSGGTQGIKIIKNIGGTLFYWKSSTSQWTTTQTDLAYIGTVENTNFLFQIEYLPLGQFVVRIFDANEVLLAITDRFSISIPQTDMWLLIGQIGTETGDITLEYLDLLQPSARDLLKKKVFFPYHKVYIKRRQTDGDYEADWYDVTNLVKDGGIGDISEELDDQKLNDYMPGTVDITFDNTQKQFCNEGTVGSLFAGFLTPYMTKVKVEYALWEDDTHKVLVPEQSGAFYGLLIDSPPISADEVTLTFNSLSYILEKQSAEDLSLLATDTASDIIVKIKDLTISGEKVFDRYIDTWNIETTTAVYSDITAANALTGMKCWDVIKRLCEAESMGAYVAKDGSFNFASKRIGDYVMPNNLMLFYKFNETSGANVTDSSGEANDAVITTLWSGPSAQYYLGNAYEWVTYPEAKIQNALKMRSMSKRPAGANRDQKMGIRQNKRGL